MSTPSSGSINGNLSGTDYGDTIERLVQEGTYDYTLKATKSGRVSFEVEVKVYPNLTESGNPKWQTAEKKTKINGGSTVTGSFYVNSNLGDVAEIRFKFKREFLSQEVGYELDFEKQ